MNRNALHVVWTDGEQAKRVLLQVVVPYCNTQWESGVKALEVVIQPQEDAKTARQRAYYHAVVLAEISEHANINGQKFDKLVWKKWFSEKFLGHRWEMLVDPTTGKKYRRKVRISTEDLGLRAYSKLIEQVTAFAMTDLDIPAFSVSNWESYVVAGTVRLR